MKKVVSATPRPWAGPVTRSQPPITELANTLGFASASHFTRHYKLMFDELPSETLKLHCYGPTIV